MLGTPSQVGSAESGPRLNPPQPARAVRLLSLDVFRGVTMASMVIVNNPGDWGTVYAPLLHAEWHGWTPTDLIFPFFLYIVGVSLTLSKGTLGPWSRIIRRTAVIFGLGLFLAFFLRWQFATLRIPGVLQRIALCYLASAAIYRATLRPSDRQPIRQAALIGACIVVLLLGYWAILMWVSVPSGGAGDFSAAGNVGAFVDRTLLGTNHLWGRRPWDPEGLLSTLPAIGTTLLGVLAGLWMRATVGAGRKAWLLGLAGVALLVCGQAWGVVFPINKNLWTSSYVLFSGGAAAVTLALCYWFIDVRGYRLWARPFEILGLNALMLFVASGLFTKTLTTIRLPGPGGKVTSLYNYLYVTLFAPLASPKNASLMFAASHLVLLFGLLYVLHRKRIYLKA